MGTIVVIVLIIVVIDRVFHYLWGGEDEPGRFKEPSAGGCLFVFAAIVGLIYLFGGK